MVPDIRIVDFNYHLPEDRIAKYPLPRRDSSKLLVYDCGKVSDHIFNELPGLLPKDALMVFNDTKVVPARLFFCRETGAHIEIFCIQPVDPPEYDNVFTSVSKCRWRCVIGNSKRWKDDVISLYNPDSDPGLADLGLRATLVQRESETGIVEFSWNGGKPFSSVLEACGNVPIPPYLNRETEEIDKERYQTLYARVCGSVAAPTAGLHFTDEVLAGIDAAGVERDRVCLHVGAGTFLPVKSPDIAGHPMHREPFSVSVNLLRKLVGRHPVIVVGTTSMRTLESLYYLGVSIIETGKPADVEQWAPYTREYPYSTEESLEAIISYMESNGMDEICADTRIIIVPGFRFRIADMLVTNFHQPESTLILLVSAFVGGDWRTIYDHALKGGYRFLSYGDSSLLKRAVADE